MTVTERCGKVCVCVCVWGGVLGFLGVCEWGGRVCVGGWEGVCASICACS